MTFGPLQILAPVLLHLLAKVRAPQVFFPTLRFLRLSMDKTARRRRVQHWLLMLLRMLALAVLAIAVAQPLVRAATGQLGSDRDTAVAIVLDNSMSMQTRQAGATRLELTRQAAVQFLKDHAFQEVALIVTNGPDARTPPDRLTDPFKARDDAQKVQGGAGRADLVAAVEHAQRLLVQTALPNREIYLFSDLQQVSLRGLETLRTQTAGPTPPSLLVVTPGLPTGPAADAGPVNLAVAEIAIEQPNLMAGQPIQLDVTVRNHSRLTEKAMVRVFQDGAEQPNLSQVVDLAPSTEPRSARHVRFALTFADPGPHWGRVQVQRINQAGVPDVDDLPDDDSRFFAMELADRVGVLLVKQHHDLDGNADAGYLLGNLMSLRDAGGPASPFRLAEITAAEFAPTLLSNVQVAISSDVAGLSPEEADAFRGFVERGGTWMIWLGPSADLNAYNAVLGQPATPAGSPAAPGLLGGQLVRYVGAGTGGQATDEEPVYVQWVDQAHPLFQGLFDDLSPYRRLLVHRHAVLQRRSDQTGRVIARLSTGDPLVVETPLGRGRVLLIATAATSRWTNWLTQGHAFAIYQMLLAAATRGRGADAYQFGENELVTMPLGRGGGDSSEPVPVVTITKPDSKAVAVPAEAAGPSLTGGELVARFRGADQIGLYRWEVTAATAGQAPEGGDAGDGPGEDGTSAGASQSPPGSDANAGADSRTGRAALGGAFRSRRGLFVVNPPAEESDLRPADARELAETLPDRPVLVGRSLADLAGRIEQYRRGSPLWPYLLAAVLVLLAIEAKLANRARPTAEPGLRPALDAHGPLRTVPPPVAVEQSARS